MLRSKLFGQYLLSNKVAAGLAALALQLPLFIGLPTAWLGIVVVAFVTLCRGSRSGGVVLLWFALPSISLLLLGNSSFFISLLLMRALPVFMLAILLRRGLSWSLLLQLSTLLALVVVALLHLLVSDLTAQWRELFAPFLEQLNAQMAWQLSEDKLLSVINELTTIATGVYAATVVTVNLLVLALARGWQAHLANPGGLKTELYQLHAPYGFALLALAIVVAWQLNYPLAGQLTPLVITSYLLIGLSLCHCLTRNKPGRRLFLLGIYILLVFFSPYAAIMAAFLGVIDSWYPLRRHKGLGT